MISTSILLAWLRRLNRIYRRWDFRHVNRWRLDLSEYESNTLIPFFQSRIDISVNELQKIMDTCVDRRNDEPFGAAYAKLVDPNGRSRKPDGTPFKNTDWAQQYFDRVRLLTQGTFDTATKVQNDWKLVTDIPTFSKAIVGLGVVCSIFERTKNTAFRVTPIAIVSITEPETGKVITFPKNEFEILNFPFQDSAENLALLGQSTRESIELWNKEQLEWKTRHLSIIEHRWSIGVNIITVFSAVVLSWLFLTLNDPYKMFVTENTNKYLNEKLIEVTETLTKKNMEVSNLIAHLTEETRALKACETASKGVIAK